MKYVGKKNSWKARQEKPRIWTARLELDCHAVMEKEEGTDPRGGWRCLYIDMSNSNDTSSLHQCWRRMLSNTQSAAYYVAIKHNEMDATRMIVPAEDGSVIEMHYGCPHTKASPAHHAALHSQRARQHNEVSISITAPAEDGSYTSSRHSVQKLLAIERGSNPCHRACKKWIKKIIAAHEPDRCLYTTSPFSLKLSDEAHECMNNNRTRRNNNNDPNCIFAFTCKQPVPNLFSGGIFCFKAKKQ